METDADTDTPIPDDDEIAWMSWMSTCRMTVAGVRWGEAPPDASVSVQYCIRDVGHVGPHCPDHNGWLSEGDLYWFDGDTGMRRKEGNFQVNPDILAPADWDRSQTVIVGQMEVGAEVAAVPVLPPGTVLSTTDRTIEKVGNSAGTAIFTTITADPPWSFDDSLPGGTRGADKQYKTMSWTEIARFPLPSLAKDCRLFLWVPSALLDEALSVMEIWGFQFKTTMVWDKRTAKNNEPWFGMGRVVRGSHELVLVGERGKPERKSKSVRSLFQGVVGKHSEKPEEFYRLVEELSPGPYMELFGRRQREGWTVEGDEVEVSS